MNLLRSLLLVCGLVAAGLPVLSAAAPFRLFEVGVTRFFRDPSGQGHVQSARLGASGTLTVDTEGDSHLIGVPDSALGRTLIFTEAWFAYGQLGPEARANFELANEGAPIAVGSLLYYEVKPHPTARLDVGQVINLSTRGKVDAGVAPSLIGGFVIEGQSRRVLIRAVGPSLAQFDVPAPVANPSLTIYKNRTPIHVNDDWAAQPDADAVEAMAAQLGAFPLPRTSRDAALLLELPPGQYSAGVGSESTTAGGAALLEIYIVP